MNKYDFFSIIHKLVKPDNVQTRTVRFYVYL